MLGQGRLVNLAAAEGHPPSVMDMSFATQALATEYCVKNKGKLTAAVHVLPAELEQYVAGHKLESMGIRIDELTSEQKAYMTRLGTGDVIPTSPKRQRGFRQNPSLALWAGKARRNPCLPD